MSYILDALKKADAEREQGQVPGLHTPVAPVDPMLGGSDHGPLTWVVGAGVVIILLGLGALAWWPRSMGVVPAPAPAPATAAMTPPTAATTSPAVAPVAVNPVTAPAPAPSPLPASTPPVITAPPPATPEPPTVAAPVRAAVRPVAETVTAAPSTPRVPIHVDPAPAASSKVPTLAELPEDVRRSLPQLAVSGAMYSDNPANRMLLVNNRVFHEGDQPVAGLVLEEIRLKSAVFRYRGTRYAVSY